MFINNYVFCLLIIISFSIIISLIFILLNKKSDTKNLLIDQLNSYMTEDLRCPPLKKDSIVRVYISGGMFDIADTLYSIGPDGLKPGLDYQSINLIDMICNFTDLQIKELEELCVLYDVPWYGVVGEIEKMGWECYCPVRDGLTMATIADAISNCTYEQVIASYDAGDAGYKKWDKSMFNPKNISNTLNTEEQIINYAKNIMMSALGINIGANDLYNMYSTCNACIMNYNGIEPDAGAVAEIGQLGARGVPCVILKGSINGDFSGISNPMPVMATTSSYNLMPNLTNNNGTVYDYLGDKRGALPFLQRKVNLFIESNENTIDPLTNGNYNNIVPLPPLQIFWADLGSKSYFLKHKSKSIQTLSNGKTDFENDYTSFWYDNVVKGGKNGLIQVAKAMADNLDYLIHSEKYKNINKYWN